MTDSRTDYESALIAENETRAVFDVSDVPAFCEVHAKREPIQPVGPSLWRRFCNSVRRFA